MHTNVQVHFNDIFYSYYKNNKRYDRKCKFEPTLYVPVELTKYESDSVGDDGKKLVSLKSKILDFFKFIRDNQEKIPIYGNVSPEYQFINKNWGNKEFNDKVINNLLIYGLDIETKMRDESFDVNNPDKEITAISIKNFKNGKFYVLSTLEFDKTKIEIDIDKERLYYKKVKSEYELLQGVVYIFENGKPDIITGYNIDHFDIPYLCNRINRLLGVEYLAKMSPYKKTKDIMKKELYTNKVIQYKDVMIPTLDYYLLYKKYTDKNNEDNKLNTIGKSELDLEKIRFEGDLDQFMIDDPQKYIEYNIWDVELVYRLDKKLKMIYIALVTAYTAKVKFPDIFSPVKVWDVMIYHHLKKQNIQVPPKKKEISTERNEGAFVFPTKAGVYKWLIIFDLKSMYPNIVISIDIGKNTILEEVPEDLKEFRNNFDNNIDAVLNNKYDFSLLKKYNVSYTPNGFFWKHGQNGYLSNIMSFLFNHRISVQRKMEKINDEDKKESSNLLQRALKYLLNAGFGVFLNNYFRYNDKRVGEGITVTGQMIIKFLLKYLTDNVKDIEMIAGDTDSLIFCCDEYVKKLGNITKEEIILKLKKFSEIIIDKYINEAFKIIGKRLNFEKNTLMMECECIGDVGIFPVKKKYIVRKVVSEGKILKETELKIRGIETVKSSTPLIVRDKLREFIEIILDFNIDKLRKELEIFKKEFCNYDVEKIASISSINHLDEYCDEMKIYKKATPIYTRGALLYNRVLDIYNLQRKYGKIKKGDKVKYIYLKSPNPLRENVISFVSKLPIEFKLHEYVDYDLQFEKIVINPLNRLVILYGVDLTKKIEVNNLDLLFEK